MMRRAYWRTRPMFQVVCDDCPWTSYTQNAQGLAAQHHDRTGHVVRVEIGICVVYGEDRPGERRWWRG